MRVFFSRPDWALQAFASGWQGEEGLRLGQPQQPQQRKGVGEASKGDGQGEGAIERRLEFCEDGFWLITPRGGGFPFYGVRLPLIYCWLFSCLL